MCNRVSTSTNNTRLVDITTDKLIDNNRYGERCDADGERRRQCGDLRIERTLDAPTQCAVAPTPRTPPISNNDQAIRSQFEQTAQAKNMH
jgi:hypothetical protein